MRRSIWITGFALIASASLAQEIPEQNEVAPQPGQQDRASESAPVAPEEAVGVVAAAPLAASDEGAGAEPTAEPAEQQEASEEGNETGEEALDSERPRGVFLGDGVAQWIMAGAAIVGVVLTAFAVWLLHGTLIETRNAANYAKRTLTEARRTTRVSLVGARAARETVDVMRDQIRADLTCTEGKFRFVPQGNPSYLEVSLRVANTGQSRARDVSVIGRALIAASVDAVVQDGPDRRKPFTGPEKTGEAIVLPGDSSEFVEIQTGLDEFSEGLSQPRFMRFAGRVIWTDIFGNPNEIKFRAKIDPHKAGALQVSNFSTDKK